MRAITPITWIGWPIADLPWLRPIQGLATLDTDILQQQVQFVTGQTVPTNDVWISSVEQQIGARQATFWGAVQTLTQSDAARTQIKGVYADWGQLPPSDAELQTAGAALYNLSRGWQVVQGQNVTEWANEAAAWRAPREICWFSSTASASSSAEREPWRGSHPDV
ncbi:hypothetical protein [Acetobacter sp. DsW_063]|uniref:hypothetical protein n=1 Tax=Acetobacter sp. DsW_063 TaxID=1514894 RepID=UPI000A386833|nr:hypothetical protein [Acetobacter sp. DsW_063]OUJ16029.1 hypothetical protein HK28_05295 [Acetobacter sp. DsW_063]